MGHDGIDLPSNETYLRGPDSPLLTIRLLGHFRVAVGGRDIEPNVWRLRKAAHLVKLLALTPGHRLHRDQMIDELWPEVDPDSALSSFHQALHAARNALEPDRAARSAQSLLRLNQQVLSLASDKGLWIDVEAFQNATGDARNSGDVRTCLGALRLYSGELLPEDLYESWTQQARDSVRQAYLDLLLTTARLQEASGVSAEAIETLRALIATDPLNEAAYATLMRLHAASGRRDQAIRVYQQLSEMLKTELDAEPAPDVFELYERISSGELAAGSTNVALPVRSPESSPQISPRHELSGGPRVALADIASQRGLFDRRNETALLQRAFDAFLADRGQIVLLAGEPGIGKTRLAEEVAHYAVLGGAAVLWARCHEAEGAPAFWPWFQIVRNSLRGATAESLRDNLGSDAGPIAQVVPDVRTLLPDTPTPAELDSNQAQFRFFDSMTAYLGRLSERNPIVLILDDLQWADRSSLTLLEFLADEIASRRIMLLGTYREAQSGDNLPLIRTLERLNRSGAQRIQLGGFELHDTARFSEFIAGRPLPKQLVETIYQRTSGNPFFAREVVQLLSQQGAESDPDTAVTWATTIPLGVREAVTLRLSQLSDEARTVLVDACVLGDGFQIDVLQAVSGFPADQLLDLVEETVSLGVIVEDRNIPDRFRFAHILTQQTLYEGLIAARRTRMHARVGTVLEQLHAGAADPPYAEIARHFYLAATAGEAERAVSYLTRAGEQSMARLAYSEAAEQFGRAVEVIERHLPDRQGELFDVLVDRARAQLASGASSDARSTRLRSVDIARDLGDPERLALAALEMVNVSSDYFEWRAADEITLLQEALGALPLEHTSLRVQVMSALALALVFDKSEVESTEREARRKRLAEDAVSIARRIGTPALLAEALLAAHAVLWTFEDVDDRLAISRELLDIALETHDPRLEMATRAQRFGEFLIKGETAEADRELDAYETLANTYHLPINLWSATTKRAMRAFTRGDFDESERLMERARVIGQRSAPEVSRLNYLMQQFFIRREQDRLHEVETTLEVETEQNPTEAFWPCLLAVLYADRGDDDEAAKLLLDLLDPNNPIPRDSFWLASMALIADSCATLHDVQHADQVLDMLRPYADLFVCPGNHAIFLGPVSHYLGRLSATSGRWDDAERFFETALQQERRTGDLVSKFQSRSARTEMHVGRAADAPSTMQEIEHVRRDAERHGLPRIARLSRDFTDRLRNGRPP